MTAGLLRRLVRETDPRVLARLALGLGWGSGRALAAFRRRAERGKVFPAFLFISVTSRCNLRCQGCWATDASGHRALDLPTLHRIVDEARRHGTRTFGILGGEPLLHGGLAELFLAHRDCTFLLFTNGTLIDDPFARMLARAGNVSPLISIEGREEVSDRRRGGDGVWSRTLDGLGCCTRAGLLTGVASSLCRSNLAELASETFVDELITRGVHYLWFYIYRPVGPDPCPELALDRREIVAVHRFLLEMRRRKPLLLVDSYWDAEGRALCPAASGLACHIGPGGDIEPCPPIQLARENVRDGDLFGLLTGSPSLAAFRTAAARSGGGCILLEDPGALARVMSAAGARDSSGRGTALAELAAMVPRSSHHLPGDEIPEPSFLYRWAKRRAFLGLGAYG